MRIKKLFFRKKWIDDVSNLGCHIPISGATSRILLVLKCNRICGQKVHCNCAPQANFECFNRFSARRSTFEVKSFSALKWLNIQKDRRQNIGIHIMPKEMSRIIMKFSKWNPLTSTYLLTINRRSRLCSGFHFLISMLNISFQTCYR